MSARNGKIARLPHPIREELNQRLEQSEEGPELLAWLNELPEVKTLVNEKFNGVPVSKQNLSEWRQGGFQTWLLREELWEQARDMQESGDKLPDERKKVLADDVATVLAARYGILISNWDGEVDERFKEKAAVLNDMARGIVRLQRELHRSMKEIDDRRRRTEADLKQEQKEIRQKKVMRMYDLAREPMVAKVFGGGELGEKIARYIMQLEHEVPDAKLELRGDEQTEQPVKRRRKKAKTEPENKSAAEDTDNTLEENGLNANEKEQEDATQSGSVKPGQTDFGASEEGGLGVRAGLRLGGENEVERQNAPGSGGV